MQLPNLLCHEGVIITEGIVSISHFTKLICLNGVSSAILPRQFVKDGILHFLNFIHYVALKRIGAVKIQLDIVVAVLRKFIKLL